MKHLHTAPLILEENDRDGWKTTPADHRLRRPEDSRTQLYHITSDKYEYAYDGDRKILRRHNRQNGEIHEVNSRIRPTTGMGTASIAQRLASNFNSSGKEVRKLD